MERKLPLFKEINQSNLTIPKLIDEYHCVTITNRIKVNLKLSIL
jgi:hypothetical protein